MRALFVLTASESKRLIGKAVARMEKIQRAMEKGKILISHGSTNVYVVEELLGREKASGLWCRDHYVSGVLLRGNLCTILATDKPPVLLLNRGKVEPPAMTMACVKACLKKPGESPARTIRSSCWRRSRRR